MSQNLQYPSNPDTSLESFLITKQDVQILNFGRTISQAECVPLNYNKIALDALSLGIIIPVRELCFIGDLTFYQTIDDENTALIQSTNLQSVITMAFAYWEDQLSQITTYAVAMGVVTEIKTSIIKDFYTKAEAIESEGLFRVVTTLKINWLTPTNGKYA
jgi:hypothetical protein